MRRRKRRGRAARGGPRRARRARWRAAARGLGRATWIRRGVLALLALATIGFLVSASGLPSITASSEHWPVTAWFLNFTMRRSVATHSLAAPSPPDLDDRARVLRGAGHYEGFCRPCHGAPGTRMPPVPQAMTPHPPRLDDAARELEPRELFYIIRHGVKFTAMPEWPAQHRDDEIWSVVAFVRRLPRLDAQRYRRLVRGEPAPSTGAPAVVERECARCHGVDGLGRGAGAFPHLAGQREAYLAASLDAFAEGVRNSGIMRPVAALLEPSHVREAAAWYARRPPMYRREGDGARGAARGRQIALEGIPEDRVPPCADCHGPRERPSHPVYPVLAGQVEGYLAQQLRLFRDGHRGGTRFADIMQTVAAHELSGEDIDAVAAFYASLRGSPFGLDAASAGR